ncbi:hypothetical protein UFOVP459_47 [uncultured Caudovirales phage]|uniref:Uncharacterized protein n=1 Tax=uncultured Caudovirales phage TaxID=2100421 RepID=A0A6J5SG73_9CAUD|nr:hypothetical protein UFOVP459_47 [uncultured Caudovirales phage]CAB4183104.1 hypothetical protein UFOVP1089_38 [uncultured Caudovirales phage]CAB4213027.1 hypothetical protein UFOVP1443_57 [uncultured Caudovirales phage]
MNKFIKPPEGYQYMLRIVRYSEDVDLKNYYSFLGNVISISDSEIIFRDVKNNFFFPQRKYWAKVKMNDIKLSDENLLSVSIKVPNGEYANFEVDRDLVSSIDEENLSERNQEFVIQNNL